MKKLKKLKLNQLSKAEVEKRELNALRGGCLCRGCGCLYEGEQCSSGDSYYGGADSGDNATANVGSVES
ncbi:hypothetical protein MNBD_BACTEROID01-355 [hydrothermal vent metagenome]|uniref:Natural product, GG-Bacteroidales family domain protein n=1 Tax=hydrothermal vent metagenome TaxID=652676 RepID=A0A3B0UYZ7_9ZZZZ